MSNSAEQALLDDIYDALEKSSKAGVSMQAAWGHIRSVELHLEWRSLQGIRKLDESHGAALEEPKEKP